MQFIKMHGSLNSIARGKKGVTLMELLAVIVIIGILAAIAIPTIGNLVSRTKERADYASMRVLNESTRLYKLSMMSDPDDIFEGIDDDILRLEKLVDEGFLASVTHPQVADTVFNWDIEHQVWLYSDISNQIIISLDSANLDITTQQIATSFDLYIDIWLEENSVMPVFNQTYASLTWSSANYVGTSQTNIFAANFWIGYFEYADTDGFDASNTSISDFKVFFKRDALGTVTTEITAVYIQMGSKSAIYFTNGVTRLQTHYSVFYDAVNKELVAPES